MAQDYEKEISDPLRRVYGCDLHASGRLYQCGGFSGNGTDLRHASLLKRYTQEVLLLYDSDEAGVKAALRAIPILREAGVNSRVVNLQAIQGSG